MKKTFAVYEIDGASKRESKLFDMDTGELFFSCSRNGVFIVYPGEPNSELIEDIKRLIEDVIHRKRRCKTSRQIRTTKTVY